MSATLALAAAFAASLAAAQTAPSGQPTVDPKAYPALTSMLGTLQNGSDASRYCAQTGGLYLEADTLLRAGTVERDVVEALVTKGRTTLANTELARLRQLAEGVTQMAVGFRALAPESSAVAYAQSCLASVRQASGTRSQAELNRRYADALACDKRFAPGSLDGKECVAKAFRYR